MRALYITRAGDWSFTKVLVENLNDVDFVDKLLGIQNGTHLSQLFRMKANDGSLSTSTFCVWYTMGEEFVQQRPMEAIRQLSAWTGQALICRCAARGPGLVNTRTGDEAYARVAIEQYVVHKLQTWNSHSTYFVEFLTGGTRGASRYGICLSDRR